MQGLIAKKVGMTRMYDKETGRMVAVTVLDATSNVVNQIKNSGSDGYEAVQIGFGARKEKRVTKPLQGHFKKYGSPCCSVLKEFKNDDKMEIKPGQPIGVEIFENTDFVDITGRSKGRGFTGTIKRHNFCRGRQTHGNKNHRAPGSIGQCSYPARVFPGLKMAGQHGNVNVTVKGLKILAMEKETNLLFIQGAVPGANRGTIIVKKSNKYEA